MQTQQLRQARRKARDELELLADLQHHGAATCLLDFTRGALIALWFACEKSETDGKVFVVNTADEKTVLEIPFRSRPRVRSVVLSPVGRPVDSLFLPSSILVFHPSLARVSGTPPIPPLDPREHYLSCLLGTKDGSTGKGYGWICYRRERREGKTGAKKKALGLSARYIGKVQGSGDSSLLSRRVLKLAWVLPYVRLRNFSLCHNQLPVLKEFNQIL